MLSTLLIAALGVAFLFVLGLWIWGERGHLMLPSSWRFLQAGGARRFFNFSDLHGYAYGRWIKEYIYVLVKIICPRLHPGGKKWLSDHYHGKVITADQARSIITVNKEIPLRDLEQIIPYSTARDLVLKGPPEVAVFQCGCRQIREHPCQPIQVCMVVGQPFVDFILEHHPATSRRLTQQEALDLLEAEHKRGHLHSAWFKDALLNRFYAICNCCKCCCGGIEAMVKHGAPMMASSGFVASVDEAMCNLCTVCEEICMFGAIRVNGELTVQWSTCMGCGVCVGQCPTGALSLVRDERKGFPLDVRAFAGEEALSSSG